MSHLPSHSVLSPRQSRELLREVDRLRRVAERPLGMWPPLVVFGFAAILGTPLALIGAGARSIWWVAIAAPCLFLTGRYSHRHCLQHGIQRPSARLIVLGVGSFLAGGACCLGIAAVTHLPEITGWAVTVGLGYLGWAWLARSAPVALIAATIVVAGAVADWLGAPPWSVQLAVGVVMVAGGTALRLGPEAP